MRRMRSPWMNSLSLTLAPELQLLRETPRYVEAERAVTESQAGARGGRRSHGTSARAAIFAQGKETGLKGSSF